MPGYTIARDETTGRYVVMQDGETVVSFRTKEGAERWVKRWDTSKASK